LILNKFRKQAFILLYAYLYNEKWYSNSNFNAGKVGFYASRNTRTPFPEISRQRHPDMPG
jgi:hypothetical protein